MDECKPLPGTSAYTSVKVPPRSDHVVWGDAEAEACVRVSGCQGIRVSGWGGRVGKGEAEGQVIRRVGKDGRPGWSGQALQVGNEETQPPGSKEKREE